MAGIHVDDEHGEAKVRIDPDQTVIRGRIVSGPTPPDGLPFYTETTATRRPLHERTDDVNRALEVLEQTIGILRTRLEPILHGNPIPEDTPRLLTRERSGDANDSWLTDYLTATTNRVAETVNEVQHILARIDL